MHLESDARAIIHLDMDCFYAAIEVRDQPSLRGNQWASAAPDRRGVLTTCNYEAREFGCAPPCRLSWRCNAAPT